MSQQIQSAWEIASALQRSSSEHHGQNTIKITVEIVQLNTPQYKTVYQYPLGRPRMEEASMTAVLQSGDGEALPENAGRYSRASKRRTMTHQGQSDGDELCEGKGQWRTCHPHGQEDSLEKQLLAVKCQIPLRDVENSFSSLEKNLQENMFFMGENFIHLCPNILVKVS
nr:unnamed protein product [Callosobruchus analis]